MNGDPTGLWAACCFAKVSEIDFSHAVVWLRS